MGRVLFIFLVILSIGYTACKTDKRDHGERLKNNQATIKEDIIQLQALPKDVFLEVYSETDYVDVIFQELPFSMSQDNKNGIQQLMQHIDPNPPHTINKSCPLFAQQVYQKEGQILIEADLFHSEGCFYYVFSYKGKRYYNAMLPGGIEFFNNLKKQEF